MLLRIHVAFLSALIGISAPQALAQGACETTPPQPCPDCFAVFVMPDTQHYANSASNTNGAGQGAKHLSLLTSWICENRAAWREPRTGKTMPIAIVIQLGDLVDNDYARNSSLRLPSIW